MRARRVVVPLTLWAALVVAVAPVVGSFLGQTKPEQAPSSTAVVNPFLETRRRFKRCSTTCDRRVVYQAPTPSVGMTEGTSSVNSSTSDGCTKITITCNGLDPEGFTQTWVRVPDRRINQKVAFGSGVGPLIMSYECGDDGGWLHQNRPVVGKYNCEYRRTGPCASTCEIAAVVQGPGQTLGMVDGFSSVRTMTTDGCTTLNVTCNGLRPDGRTHLSVALRGGVGRIDFRDGAGPAVMKLECGHDGNWTHANYPISGEYYCESSPLNMTTTTTTRRPTTLTTPARCAYPTNTSQVSLVVFDGEPRGGNTGEIGSCGCDVGKKAFYVGGPSPGAYSGTYSTFIEYPLQKEGPLACADLCIIDEAGDECKFSNISAQMTIYFKPYCTRGKCHTYVYMGASGDESGSNGLICGSRNFIQRDQWNDDGSVKLMDPDTAPQAYVHAAAFTCKGCAAIRNSNCLRKPGCAYPTNSSQVSFVYDGEPRGGNTKEIGSCSCDIGKKAFYVSGPTAGAPSGTYATMVEYPLQKDGPQACADFCIIDELGDECKFSNTSAKMKIFFKPYCTRGKCHMYVYFGQSDDSTGLKNGLICTSRNFTQRVQWNADGSLKAMDPDTSPQAYVHAAAFTCKGCAAIRNSDCLKRPGCAYLTNSSQPSLVVFDGEPRGGNTEEIGSCGCDIGKKAFYAGGPTSSAPSGTYATMVEYPLQKDACVDFCIIDEFGDECRFSNTSAKMKIFFKPYCTRGKCHTYVYFGQSGDNTGLKNGLICTSRNFTQRVQWNADGSLKAMDPDTSPQVYVHAAAFTCKGCAAIRNSSCLKRPDCVYPTNSSQVSLVFDGEPRGGNTKEIGSCSCNGGKKAFYASGSAAGAYSGKWAKDGDQACADLCIIDEAGDECRFSNTSAYMTIFFKPYCARGKCHMYVYMGASDDNTGLKNGLMCGSRNYTQRDGWNADGSLKAMDPDTSPQAYVHAAAYSCKGCAALRNSNCLKKPTCPPGGTWSAWTAGPCNDTCGLCGTQTLTRKCTSEANGCPCEGPDTSTQKCAPKPCDYPRASCCPGAQFGSVGGNAACVATQASTTLTATMR